MGRLTEPEKITDDRPSVRTGRPSRGMAGEVEERILDAARRVFLEKGLNGASVDEISRLARAGKPTIYSRFPTKEVLFRAVADRHNGDALVRFREMTPAGTTLEERLVSVGSHILERLLSGDTVDFMRLAISESHRFPDLANVGTEARERAAQGVTYVLAEVAKTEGISAYPAFAADRIAATARFFMDLVVLRLLMRALTGEDREILRQEVATHVPRAVTFFLGACRNG